MKDVLKQQYSFIRSTRQTLFAFLEGIPLQKLHKTVPNFGNASIIRTHIHVADCYLGWLGKFALKQNDFSFATVYDIEHSDVKKVRNRFELVDEVVQQFLDEFNSRWFDNIANQVKWQKEPWSTTPLWLLTHTETHEFHHKGQIVSMARHLGYNPPDTDLVAP
ncbi:DinB family protein [Bacillus sp. sid0103]|uniref:DinB family protein n=1 Tax=Bacillus sp. sid0103 TaxID=2856337 RepID=UPI001C492169|nr:DinB family protein [Bacillus sp. sid0103]MBV7509765.1 DinB family protein [Bacillus sp. sid0103]